MDNGIGAKFAQTHEQILNAGIRIMSAEGFANATIEQICGMAEISRSTFYYHFKTKEELVAEYFKSLGALTHERLSWVFSAPTAREKAIRMQLSYFTDPSNCQDISLYIVSMKNHLSRACIENSKLGDDMKQVIVPLIKQAQEAGEIRNMTSPEELGDAAVCMQWGNMYLWCISNGSFDRVAAFERMLNTLYDSAASPEK